MPSFPSLATVHHLLDSSPPHPQSETIAHHIKAHSFEKRMYPYILENFRLTTGSLSETIFLSQLVQSEAMAAAFKGWRAKWGNERHCGGALVWQFNDVWPSVSWSITSFLGSQPKQAFYAISRSLASVTLLIRRISTDPKPNSQVEELCANKTSHAGAAKLHSTPHIYPPKKSCVSVVLSNITPCDYAAARVEIRYISLATGVSTTVFSAEVGVAANANVSLWNAEVPEDEPTLVYAVLFGPGGDVVAREVDWPQPVKFVGDGGGFRELGVGDGELRVEWQQGGVQVTTGKAVKAVWFEEMPGEKWENNCVDLVPGETLGIRVEGLEMGVEGEGRKVWWYGW